SHYKACQELVAATSEQRREKSSVSFGHARSCRRGSTQYSTARFERRHHRKDRRTTHEACAVRVQEPEVLHLRLGRNMLLSEWCYSRLQRGRPSCGRKA